MSTVFYYLLKQPDIMHRLQLEIRSYFKSYDEITALSTNNLPFMIAVIREAMRVYPPLALALPRVVPEGGDTIDGHFVPAGVRHARYERNTYSNFYRPRCQHILLQRA
jgi:cytochrome P450